MQEHPDQMKLEDEPFLKGTIQAVIFHNESNLYSVLKVKVIETSENLEEKQHLSQATSPHFMRRKPTPLWQSHKPSEIW